MTMFSERSLVSDLLGTWMTKEWLGSARANRFFRACSLENMLFLVTFVFVFWGSRPWRLDLFHYSQVRIIFGLLGWIDSDNRNHAYAWHQEILGGA